MSLNKELDKNGGGGGEWDKVGFIIKNKENTEENGI